MLSTQIPSKLGGGANPSIDIAGSANSDGDVIAALDTNLAGGHSGGTDHGAAGARGGSSSATTNGDLMERIYLALVDLGPNMEQITRQFERALQRVRTDGDCWLLKESVSNLALFLQLVQVLLTELAVPASDIQGFDTFIDNAAMSLDEALATGVPSLRLANVVEANLLPALGKWPTAETALWRAFDRASLEASVG